MQDIHVHRNGRVERIYYGIEEDIGRYLFTVNTLTPKLGKVVETREPTIKEMIDFQRATAQTYRGLLSELMRPEIRTKVRAEAKSNMYQAEAMLETEDNSEEVRMLLQQAIELFELEESI